MTPETKRAQGVLLKAALLDGDSGGVTGYPSATRVLDEGGDIVAANAFSRWTGKFLERGFVAVDHEWSYAGTVAMPTEASEDAYGLKVTCVFHSTPDAQAVRTKIAERQKAGLKVLLSIGYFIHAKELIFPADYEKRLAEIVRPEDLAETLERAKAFPRIRLLTDVELAEFSFVPVPMNPAAEVTDVKTAEQQQKSERSAAEVKAASILGRWAVGDAGMAAVRSLVDALCWNIGYEALDDEESPVEDRLALWEAGCAEFTRLSSGILRALLEAGPEAAEQGAKALRELFADPECAEAHLSALPLMQTLEGLGTAASGAKARVGGLLERRVKDGRKLSAQQVSHCAGLAQTFADLSEGLKGLAEQPTSPTSESLEVRHTLALPDVQELRRLIGAA